VKGKPKRERNDGGGTWVLLLETPEVKVEKEEKRNENSDTASQARTETKKG
jgi:hypothetical protein